MKLVDKSITIAELQAMTHEPYADMVKAVVDIERGMIVVDAELHSDEESFLLDHGSKQADLWGINIYPRASGEDMIEFDSMINLRPTQGNRTRGVDDPLTRERIRAIVTSLIKQ